jgi:integrase
MRYPFTLYKVTSKAGTIWHARLWDNNLNKYAYSRTTGIPVEGKRERRKEAEDVARKIYEELSAQIVPAPTVTLTPAPEQLPQAPAPQGFPQAPEQLPPTPQALPTAPAMQVLPPAQAPQVPPKAQKKKTAVADTPLIQYLENFWTPESEYACYNRDVKNDPLTPYYIQMNHEDIRRHVQPFPEFEGVTLGSLTKAILKKWMIWLAGRRKVRTMKDGTVKDYGKLSGRRANSVLQAVRVAVRWAVDNEDIPTDPFRKLGEVSEMLKEKGVLTFEEREKLTELPVTDCRSRLIMLLGSYGGLRRGEMRGLRWCDILDNGLIHVQHSYNNTEGLKPPKYNSIRRVPITSDVQKLLDMTKEQSKKLSLGTSSDDFILASHNSKYKGKPLSNNFYRSGVAKELESIGISAAQQDERDITCHSLRHTFITLAQLSGIPDIEIQALAGHKSAYVMGKYSHVPQVIDFAAARKKLEAKVVSEQKTENLPKAANA